jgi:membrane protease YdiL (CAAX protease family)
VSTPAQRPPESLAPLERIGKAIAELLLLGVSVLAGMAALYVLMLLGVLPDPNAAAWSAVAAGPILLGVASLSYLSLERMLDNNGDPARPLEMMEGRERAGIPTGVLIALGAVVAAMIGSVLLSLAQKFVFSVEVEEQQVIVELVERGDPFELAILGVSAVIFAPLCEELLFRHMFFRRLRQRAGAVAAWTLPGLAFAVAHGNLVGLLVYVWLATVFAAAYALSGRIWVAMLAHAGHNAFAFTMLLYAPEVLP